MTRKHDNGNMAARLSLAAGVLLALLVGATEAYDGFKYLSEHDTILKNIDKMLLRLKQLKDGTDFFNKTIPTYSQFNFESYIDLSEKADLDNEFDRSVTEYTPLVVKRHSKKTLCKSCTAKDWAADPLAEKQQVCIASYSDYKADWVKQFDPEQTSKTTFNKIDGSVKNTDIMSRTGLALYKEDKGKYKMQMLAIPFASLDSFIILMKPIDGTTLERIARENSYEYDNFILDMLYKLAPTNVKIQLPKFKDTISIDFPSAYWNPKKDQIFKPGAETAILKEYPNALFKYYNTNIAIELNEEGINFNAKTVAGNVKCDGLPERKIPTLKKSTVKSPYIVPEVEDLVAGLTNGTLKPASDTVIEFNGTSPFLYIVLTTDLAQLAIGTYFGN